MNAKIERDNIGKSCHVSILGVSRYKPCSEMYEISMIPDGMTMVTWPLELSISSGTLFRLMIEASSGSITVVFVVTSAFSVQYLPVFEVKS